MIIPYASSQVSVLCYFIYALFDVWCCEFYAVADKLQNVALFIGLQEDCEQPNLTPNFPYSFCYQEESKEIVLDIQTQNSACISSADWIKGHLFPKMIKWAETADIKNESSGLVTSSLALVNVAKYSKLYQELKKKYGLQMVQVKPYLFTRCVHVNVQ
jgi:hypothetical protein